ncbi:MAG: WHG domain-containing protein [Solirubrobacterales bacterium]
MSAGAKARVVDAAGKIADADGLEAVTLSRVAAEVGMRPPSLYNHIRGRDALLRELGLEAVAELAAVIRDAAVGRSREDAIRALAVAYRSYAVAHPGRYAATVRAPDPDDREATEVAATAIAPMLAILAGWDIEGDEAVHLVRVIRSSLHGFVSIEIGGGFGLPLDLDHSFDLLVDSLVAAIAAASPG